MRVLSGTSRLLIELSSNSRDTGPMRILVVEDNSTMLDAIERGLLAEGFDVDTASNGLDGLWRAREFPYDAIVLDIMLPGINGYEMCRTLRSEQIVTPIVMLTAKDGDFDVAEGLDLGADDYLTKPFSFVVLVARLRAVMRRATPTADSTLRVGGLSIDTATRHCSLDGVTIELTPREYSLLEAFAKRAGEPLTRDQLRDLVWGADYDGASNVVDVYVGYLRKKLHDDRHADVVETVRGVGYRLASR